MGDGLSLPRRIEQALAGRARVEPAVADVLRSSMDLADIEDPAARGVLQAIAALIDQGSHPAWASVWATFPDAAGLRACELAAVQIMADTDLLTVAVAKCAAARIALRAVRGEQP